MLPGAMERPSHLFTQGLGSWVTGQAQPPHASEQWWWWGGDGKSAGSDGLNTRGAGPSPLSEGSFYWQG